MEVSFNKAMTLFSNNQQLTFIVFSEHFELKFSDDIILHIWRKLSSYSDTMLNFLDLFRGIT